MLAPLSTLRGEPLVLGYMGYNQLHLQNYGQCCCILALASFLILTTSFYAVRLWVVSSSRLAVGFPDMVLSDPVVQQVL